MARTRYGDGVRALLVLVDLLVLVVAAGAVPVLRAARDRPPPQPTAEQAVAHLERTWQRASRLPGPASLVRLPGIEVTDDCAVAVAGAGAPVADDGRRAVTWVSAPLGPEAPALLARVRRALREVGHAPRPTSGRGEALGDAYGYAWLLRTDGQRAAVTGSTPCLLAERSPASGSP